jgi:hypothetical protein
MWEARNKPMYKNLVGKFEAKEIAWDKHTYIEKNIKMDLKK